MVRKLLAALAFAALTACAPPMNGLLVSPEARDLGGGLYIERLADGQQLLVLDGEITGETSFRFQALLEQADVTGLVIAQSPGGTLLAAHQIGRAIEKANLNTAVLVSCRSACVDIFIAGETRSIAEGAELGLHASNNPEFGYSIDKPYWTSFGFGAVNERAYRVAFDEIWLLTPEEALELNLATEILR
ncbi:MAG: hypothetical protein QNJ35_12930 [Paracoccaceae bacterium]|nr:hypothetical protein [Paracoccaceae bacterium]